MAHLQRLRLAFRGESASRFPDPLLPASGPRADLPGELGPKVAEQGPGAALGQTFYVHQSQQGWNRSERARLSSQKPPVQPLQLQLPPGLARQVVEEAADRQREPPVPEAILPQGDSHPGRGHPGLHL